MGKPTDYSKKFIELLQQLKRKYPPFSHPRNIATAFADYGDFWGMSEKEACFALEKYIAELELDSSNIVSDDYLDEIVEDAKHLFDPTEEEDEDREDGVY